MAIAAPGSHLISVMTWVVVSYSRASPTTTISPALPLVFNSITGRVIASFVTQHGNSKLFGDIQKDLRILYLVKYHLWTRKIK